MSEPVAQSDVEDVLSSIRRLVSETKPERTTAVSERGRAFVLTPQLRVPARDVLVLKPEDAVEPGRSFGACEAPDPSGLVADSTNKDKGVPHEGAMPEKLGRSDISELTAKIAALETQIATTVDQWEPDGAGCDAYAGTSSPATAWRWQEDVELDGSGQPLTEFEPDQMSSPVVTTGGADALTRAMKDQLVDEEALRAMVAEIVRSELQGVLGERITRNVRKLVRREIHRALTTQSLE